MSEVKVASKPRSDNGGAHTKEIAPRAPSAISGGDGGPHNFLRRFAREMDQLFEDFGLGTGFHFPRLLSRGHELLRREAGFIPAEWSPRVDVVAKDGQMVIRADLPGMSKDDIKVEITDDLLTIQGERKHEAKDEREGCCYSECSYGSFYRAIPLPEGADASKASADFRKGVLEVTLPTPSKPQRKAQRLEIKEAK
jgi:HSP20 family protein